MGAGPKPGGLLFAFLVSDRSPRIMSFASAEWRNLSDGPQGNPDTSRAHSAGSWLRRSPRRVL